VSSDTAFQPYLAYCTKCSERTRCETQPPASWPGGSTVCTADQRSKPTRISPSQTRRRDALGLVRDAIARLVRSRRSDGEVVGVITPFWLLYALHDALTKPTPGNHLAPSLAESWTLSPDQRVYEFKLREGLKFHNGDLFTAEDVKFSIKRANGKLLHENGEGDNCHRPLSSETIECASLCTNPGLIWCCSDEERSISPIYLMRQWQRR
jgi:ABC-type transport system substrate-binding protein